MPGRNVGRQICQCEQFVRRNLERWNRSSTRLRWHFISKFKTGIGRHVNVATGICLHLSCDFSNFSRIILVSKCVYAYSYHLRHV